ncbi:hypothetical protein THRCLA_03902 [Thraustotheca clavata]|uniref:Inorganic phosphate transporter n=1 Tax=Thraustotheca clavata TaxID=74557 RepID=A0A1W0A0L6_9STRA|nr:hypothetical protein THRCLA_03902 [Thraustotheca clavata]
MKWPTLETVKNIPPAFITLGLVLLSKTFIDSENSVHVWIIRGLYAIAQLGCVLVLFFLYLKSRNNPDPALVVVKEDLGFGMQGEKTEKITVGVHDQRVALKEMQKIVLGFAVATFLHVKWEFIPPLVIGIFSGPNGVYHTPIVRVLLHGERAWGKLQRPWAEPVNALANQWESWNDTIASALTGEPMQKKSKKDKSSRRKQK